jgi:hypothetical protein
MLADISGKKKAYLKSKIEEVETNSKINNIRDLYRGINDVKKGYQPRTRIVKDEKGDLVNLQSRQNFVCQKSATSISAIKIFSLFIKH